MALRLGAAYFYRSVPLSPAGDDRQYWSIAESLASGGGYSWRGAPTAYRAPLYPLFLAGLRRFAGLASPGSVRLVQALWSGLGLWILFRAGAELAGPPAASAALALAALDPAQALLPTSLYLESFYSVLLLASAWALVRWRRRGDSGGAALLGLSLGLTLACRSTLAGVPLLLAAWRVFELGWSRRALRQGVLLLAGAAVPVLPWIARNAAVFRAFIPFESGVAGPVLYYASEGRVRAPADEAGEEPLRTMYRTLPPEAWDAYSARLAWANVRRSPLRYASGCLARAFALWTDPYLPYLLHDHPALAPALESGRLWDLAGGACMLVFLAAAAAALAGAWALRRDGSGRALTALVLCFNVYVLGTVFARFLSPAVPLLYLLAGAALAPRPGTSRGPRNRRASSLEGSVVSA